MFAGILGTTRLLCWAINFVYGYLASDGGLVLPETFPTSRLLEFADRLLTALRNTNHVFQIKDRSGSYTANQSMLIELLNELAPCVFDTEKITQPDGDYLKHALNHARVMLL